jgi:cell division inhibitor SepF
MGAMYRLKAYFGMVPADEMADYAEESAGGYSGPRRRDERWAEPADRFDYADRADEGYGDAYAEPRGESWDRRPGRPGGMERTPRDPRPDREPVRGGGLGAGSVRGALAVDPDAALRESALRESALRESALRESALRDASLRDATLRESSLRESALREAALRDSVLRDSALREAASTAVPEQRDRGAAALSRITTLQPRSYKEARTIGERYRDGVPVIMNLTELDAADAKRLVDFAAGLAFALRGSIDKVTNRVFLLTPADVEVSADDARRLAERELFRQD